MALTIKAVVMCGILLAIMDIFHGLATLGFYTYQFVVESFYLCPLDLPVDECHNKIYIWAQMYDRRVKIGMGEGGAGVLFSIFYIVALVKHQPSLTWVWLLKSFTVIAINIYYLSSWLIRQGQYGHIIQKIEGEDEFIFAGKGLTLAQIIIMVLYCLIGAIFTYKVAEERIRSRRSLRMSRKWRSEDATSPALGNYNEEEGQFLNQTLTNSQKTLPIKTSMQSLTDLNRADNFKHTTGV